jgi:hypothetical protein
MHSYVSSSPCFALRRFGAFLTGAGVSVDGAALRSSALIVGPGAHALQEVRLLRFQLYQKPEDI